VNRNQFLVALVALAVLVGGGVWLAAWKRSSYEVADARVGQRLLEGFKVDEVAQVDLADAAGTVTLVRGERGWSVKERGGFPADVEPIRELLVKLHELKVVQAEGLTDAVRPRLQLAAPGAGAKPEETGTLVELKARDGKSVAKLVLGKQAMKESKIPGLTQGQGIPSGRYVWVAADPQRVSVVSEPFAAVGAKPHEWLAKELLRLERPRSLTAIGPDGREKWSVFKEAETGDWKLAGAGTLDPGKAQDAASALYGLRIGDAAAGVSDAEAGLDKPTVIRAATFEGWNYEVRIGKLGPQDRYYVRTSVTGAVPETRTPPADETAENKEKNEKAFAERKELLAAKLAREQAVAGQTVLVEKSAVEPLLRDRAALLAKPKDAKKQGARR
jgi:hypothetical protein